MVLVGASPVVAGAGGVGVSLPPGESGSGGASPAPKYMEKIIFCLKKKSLKFGLM